MTIFLETFLCFIAEMVSFLLCFLWVKKLKLKNRYSLLLFMIIAVIVQLVWQTGLHKTRNVALAMGFIFPFFCKDWNIKSIRNIINSYFFYVIAALAESLSYGISVYMVAVFSGYEVDEINGNGYNFLCLLLFPVILIIYHLVECYVFKGTIKLLFLKEQKMALFIALFSGLFCIVMHIFLVVKNSNTKEMIVASGISFVCLIVIYMFTIIWQGRVVWKNQQLLQQQSTYDYLTKSQKQYLDYVIKRNGDLRSFKHDIRAHMLILKELAQKNDMDGILAYIDRVNDITYKNQTQNFTGNSMVDAIINDLNVRMEQEKIKLSVEGQIISISEDKEFDVSICLYNLLLNAIEALEELDIEDRNIKLEIMRHQNKNFFKISNRCNVTEDIKEITELTTTKADSKNHGIGSKNIAEIVIKNKGKINYSTKAGWFIAELLM